VQVKNKPCMIYILMRLIPWKQSHGSEKMTTGTGQLKKKVSLDRSVWWGRLDNRSAWTGQRGLGGRDKQGQDSCDRGELRTRVLEQDSRDMAAGIRNPKQIGPYGQVSRQVILERTEGTGQPWQDSAQCSEHIYFCQNFRFSRKYCQELVAIFVKMFRKQQWRENFLFLQRSNVFLKCNFV
jgi:hypothetical protein